MSLGAVINSLRVKKNLSKKELSVKAGISLTSLHYIENDVNSPTVNTLEKLASALGVSVSTLISKAKSKASGE